MRMRRFAVATVVLAVAATAAAGADSRIEFKVTEGKGASMQAILIGQGKIRSDADATTSVILDPTAGSMTVLEHSKKTFTRLTRADIDKLAASLGDLMKQMEQAMANMPPEMREMMKGRLGGAGMAGPVVELIDTGERGTAGGRACRIFQAKSMGRVVSESCMGDPSVIELAAADRATLSAAMAWTKDLADKLSQGPLARMGSASPFRGGLVPLRTTTINADGSRHSSEFSGVTNAAIPPEAFTVPAGYKEQKIELPGGRGRGGRP